MDKFPGKIVINAFLFINYGIFCSRHSFNYIAAKPFILTIPFAGKPLNKGLSYVDRSFLCEYYYSPTGFRTPLFFQTPPNQSLFQFGYVSVPESV